MVCLLDHHGVLKIYNTTSLDEVLTGSDSFKEVDGPSMINMKNIGPCLTPKQFVTFPGRVRQICSAMSSEVTILADRFGGDNNTVIEEHKSSDEGPNVYVLGDMVKDNDVNIMKFNIRKVEGI